MKENREDLELLPPAQNFSLFGHEAIEKNMLDAWASGKMPNAWLITGPRGIGKATLAHRFARFLLTAPEPPQDQSDGLFGDTLAVKLPESLEVNPESPPVRRILAGSHGDLLVLDSHVISDDKVRMEISVDEVRKVKEFLSMTPSESSWRVVIVDCADDLNRQAANAMLKLLEEPPHRAMIIMVSHNPGRLLPTIRSRCRFLKLKPLSSKVALQVVQHQIPSTNTTHLEALCEMAGGSPGLAMEFFAHGGLEIYGALIALFMELPQPSIHALHSLGEKVAGKQSVKRWEFTTYLLQYLIAGIVNEALDRRPETQLVEGENTLKQALAQQCPLAQWVDLWEEVGHISSETERANLDKKLAIVTMFNRIKNTVAA